MPELHQQMVEVVAAARKVGELANEFGRHETSISSWIHQAQADALGGGHSDAPAANLSATPKVEPFFYQAAVAKHASLA